jgi:membrane protease YdiL (CAAX protease family)
VRRLALAAVLALGGTAVFVLGSPYYNAFPTNGNVVYYGTLTAFTLALSLVLKRSRSLSRYWRVAYAFFVASAPLLALSTGILDLQRRTMAPLQFIAMDKLSQFLYVVPLIVILTLLAGDTLRDIYLTVGRLRRGLRFGLVSFGGFAVLAFALNAGDRSFLSSLPAALPWLLLFVLANAVMEELWFRAIFLRKYEALIGRAAAIAVTAIVFGASHVNATYDFPGGGIVFGLVVTGLGLGGAYAMAADDSLVGPVLFHAGYDLVVLVPILNSI